MAPGEPPHISEAHPLSPEEAGVGQAPPFLSFILTWTQILGHRSTFADGFTTFQRRRDCEQTRCQPGGASSAAFVCPAITVRVLSPACLYLGGSTLFHI